MSSPVVLKKYGLLKLLKSCSILYSHWCFFSKMCLVGSAHDPIAEKEWRCHCQLTDPNGLSGSVTLKSRCTLHCSDLAGDTLAAEEFPCCTYLTKNGRKSVCWFYWSIIRKHSCISVAHQLKWKSMAHSSSYGEAGSFPVCRPLVICKFAHESSECSEIVLSMFDSLYMNNAPHCCDLK